MTEEEKARIEAGKEEAFAIIQEHFKKLDHLHESEEFQRATAGGGLDVGAELELPLRREFTEKMQALYKKIGIVPKKG